MIKRRLIPSWTLPGLFLLIGATTAPGRTMEAGTLWVNGAFGPGLKLGEKVGGSDGFLMLNGGIEYSLSPSTSIVTDLDLGLASTSPCRLHAGARYRWTGLGTPFSPFTQLQLSAGTVFNALGANLGLLGLRMSGGVDYFVTSRLSGGIVTHLELNTTLGETSAFYGVSEWLVTTSYSF